MNVSDRKIQGEYKQTLISVVLIKTIFFCEILIRGIFAIFWNIV